MLIYMADDNFKSIFYNPENVHDANIWNVCEGIFTF